jgi:hypothetical protein
MSTEFERVESTIEVPRETGVDGFVVAIRAVLKQPRVQKVEIDARGKVLVTRFVRANEPVTEIGVDFSSVTPSSAVRSGYVIEVQTVPGDSALGVVARLFAACARDQMYPVAFIVGADSSVNAWLAKSGYDVLLNGSMYGQRVLADRHIPDDVLILATSYGPHGDLVDVHSCYKCTLPLVLPHAVLPDMPLVRTEDEETPT